MIHWLYWIFCGKKRKAVRGMLKLTSSLIFLRFICRISFQIWFYMNPNLCRWGGWDWMIPYYSPWFLRTATLINVSIFKSYLSSLSLARTCFVWFHKITRDGVGIGSTLWFGTPIKWSFERVLLYYVISMTKVIHMALLWDDLSK